MSDKPIAISWSGGKDCFLALATLLQQQQIALEDCLLVTFVPEHGDFLSHPLGVLELHSQQLGVPHEFLIVDEFDWQPGYDAAFHFLKEQYRVKSLITGEVAAPETSPYANERYWLADTLQKYHIHLANPVTPHPARRMLELLDEFQIEATTTGIKEEYFHPQFLGRAISWQLLEQTDMTQLKNFGWYGENGEYHTCVTRYQGHAFVDDDWSLSSTRNKGDVVGLEIDPQWHQLKHHKRRFV
jgi:diphthamide synthase (EF-2-diphthine--ammonia ligase)